MSIIQRRIERRLAATYADTPRRQAIKGNLRREGQVRGGGDQYTEDLHVRVTVQMARRLDVLAQHLKVNRALIMREALDFFLGMAEQEGFQHVETRVKKQG